MKKFIIFIFIFSLFFSGCVNSLSNNQENQKVKLDKDALYIKNNYLLLGKIDINSSANEEKVVLNYLRNLIYTTYSKKFFIKQEVPNSNGILVFTLILKDPFWRSKKDFLIREKCSEYLKDLQRLKNYIKHPTSIESAIISGEIQGINEACYDKRAAGGYCKIIHNVNELYEFLKYKYKKCINTVKYDNSLRQTKIGIKLTYMKYKKARKLVINIVKKNFFDKKLIAEEYIVLRTDNKLYILSLNKRRKFSKIFNRKLKFLSYNDLLKIKDNF